jgi:AcrR family transcriptional regulator
VLLQAALDVLAETGYEGMTVDMVAARARAGKATLYRRWPSKAHIVADAVASLATVDISLSQVPDSGSLRGDLLTLMVAAGPADDERNNRIIAGLFAVFPRDPDLAAVVQERLVAPRAAIIRKLLERARARGEIGLDRDLDLLALTIPAMIAYRLIFMNVPMGPDFPVAIIDQVLLPAAGITAKSR